jgi:hypothetical protein
VGLRTGYARELDLRNVLRVVGRLDLRLTVCPVAHDTVDRVRQCVIVAAAVGINLRSALVRIRVSAPRVTLQRVEPERREQVRIRLRCDRRASDRVDRSLPWIFAGDDHVRQACLGQQVTHALRQTNVVGKLGHGRCRSFHGAGVVVGVEHDGRALGRLDLAADHDELGEMVRVSLDGA